MSRSGKFTHSTRQQRCTGAKPVLLLQLRDQAACAASFIASRARLVVREKKPCQQASIRGHAQRRVSSARKHISLHEPQLTMDVRVDPSVGVARSPLSFSAAAPDDRCGEETSFLFGGGGATSFLATAPGLLVTCRPKPGGADAVAVRIVQGWNDGHRAAPATPLGACKILCVEDTQRRESQKSALCVSCNWEVYPVQCVRGANIVACSTAHQHHALNAGLSLSRRGGRRWTRTPRTCPRAMCSRSSKTRQCRVALWTA